MGLQIWLPLNGNLENKGLSNINITGANLTVDTNGKIGSCYSFNGSNSSLLISNAPVIKEWTESTVCFWIKNTANTTQCIINHRTGIGKGLAVFIISNKIRIDTDTSMTTFNYACDFSQWIHVAIVSKTDERQLYINGELVETKSVSGVVVYQNSGTYASIGGSSTNSASVNGGNWLKGLLNDFRLYDEALSPMQIKLISQGLVAHYLLNNSSIPNSPNLLKKQIKETVWSLWGYGDATREKVTIGNKVWAHVIQNDTTRYDGFYISPENNGIIIDHNRQYIISFTAKGSSNQPNSEIIVWWHWRSTEGGANIAQNSTRINISDDTPRRYSCIIPKYTHATYDVNRINIMMGSCKANNEIYFTDVKFEEGDVATPWIPNEEDAEYTALGLNNNIEYDVSGYCYNGTKYNITDYTSDTPRYSVATKFNGTNSYINIGRGGMVRDEITVNIWGYMDDWAKYNGKLISCTEGGGWNFEPSSGKIHFALGTGNTSNTYKSPTGYALSELSSGWHMFTGTYDGFTVKQYVDGVLNTSVNAYTTKTMVFYNANNSIIIGAEASGGAGGIAGSYFNGYLSDFRIYATALSESNIQSLYNNSAFIDSSGNVYSTEYTES